MTDDQIRNIDEGEGRAETGITVGRIVGVLLIAALVAFIFQNRQNAEFTVFFWQLNMPVYLLAAIIFALGWFGGYFSKSRKVRRARKAMK